MAKSLSVSQILIFSSYLISGSVSELHFLGCIYSNSTLTFECNTEGNGSTIWQGSAFKCPSSGNVISLFHSRFNVAGGNCNDGLIEARNFMTENNSFTSRLTVINALYVGDIECIYDDGLIENIIGNASVPTLGCTTLGSDNSSNFIEKALLSPPDHITWTFVGSSNEIKFNWESIISHCYDFHYEVYTLNCGTCPKNTTQTTVTCTAVPTDGSMCVFTIQTVVCDSINGNLSEPLHIKLIQKEHDGTIKVNITVFTSAIGSSVILCLILIFLSGFVIFISKRKTTNSSVNKEESPTNLTLSEDVNNSFYASCPPMQIDALALPQNEQNIYQSLELKKISQPLSYSQEYNHLIRSEMLKRNK